MLARTLASPLGPLRLVASGDALVAIWLPDHVLPPGGAALDAPGGDAPVLAEAAAQLAAYFAGRRLAFDLPLAPRGTPFQRRVWDELRRIPPATTIGYGELARRIGRPHAARAVGTANARNPLSIVVPCHRVIGAGGALTGYAGGLAAKRWLLEHEARVATRAGSTAPARAATAACRT